MSPDQIAKSGTEHSIQSAFFAWRNMALKYGWEAADDENSYLLRGYVDRHYGDNPGILELEWIHAIPNGGSRGDSKASRNINGLALKAEGVKPGIPDIFLPVPRGNSHGLYIEMKTSSGGVSPEQRRFAIWCETYRYGWVLCRSWRDARDETLNYLQIKA